MFTKCHTIIGVVQIQQKLICSSFPKSPSKTLLKLLNKGKEIRDQKQARATTNKAGTNSDTKEISKATKQKNNLVLADAAASVEESRNEAFEELKAKFMAFSRNPTQGSNMKIDTNPQTSGINNANSNSFQTNSHGRNRSTSEERENVRFRSISIGSSIGRRSSAGPTARTTSSDEKQRSPEIVDKAHRLVSEYIHFQDHQIYF